jgi:hypothetical protein
MISSEVSKGVDLKSLSTGSLIEVQTHSRRYHIEFLGGNRIRISGHPDYCPAPELAQLQGSIDNEGVVEVDLIEPGMRLIFVLGNRRPVTTSTVLAVHVDQPNAVQPQSSASIH